MEAANASLRAELESQRAGGAAQAAARTAAEHDNVALRAELIQLRAMTGAEIAARVVQHHEQLAAVRGDITAAEQELDAARAELARVRVQIVQTEQTALLQESGVYEYHHRLDDAVAYKDHLDQIKQTVRSLIREGGAVLATTDWSVNGSARDGRKMVTDFSKLMLRAYNAEADNCVRTVRPHTRAATLARLDKTRNGIARLGKTMNIRIAEPYHAARVLEINLTADHAAKVDEEKERIRAEREQVREEEKARKEFEREKARLLKERSHYESAVSKVRDQGGDTLDLQRRLDAIDDAIAGVESREANIRTGHVYVISNIGAFGSGVVKIGLTRRLDPEDRIRELGDASVPFRFDTHALVFSQDAVTLEARLHQEFAHRRVNQVNHRREFFRVTPAEVRDVLTRIAGQHLLEFHDTPEALEWRASTPDAA